LRPVSIPKNGSEMGIKIMPLTDCVGRRSIDGNKNNKKVAHALR
jgi:hypothetical protein